MGASAACGHDDGASLSECAYGGLSYRPAFLCKHRCDPSNALGNCIPCAGLRTSRCRVGTDHSTRCLDRSFCFTSETQPSGISFSATRSWAQGHAPALHLRLKVACCWPCDVTIRASYPDHNGQGRNARRCRLLRYGLSLAPAGEKLDRHGKSGYVTLLCAAFRAPSRRALGCLSLCLVH